MRKSSFVVFSAFLLASCASGPSDEAKEFVTATADGNTGRAIELIDPSIRQVAGPKLPMMLQAQASKIRDRGGISEISTAGEDVTGDQATVKLRITYKGGFTEEAPFKMRQVDGKWYVTPS